MKTEYLEGGDWMDLFSLEEKVALVTGAGRGIGRGIAEGLSSYGAAVVAASRTRSELDSLVERPKGVKSVMP